MFRINCTEQVAKGGRSELTHGLQFFRHPDSSFQIVQQTPTLATPALTHSPKPSARSTSLNTPSGLLKGDTASSPVQAHQLTRRLSQFQLGSVAGSQHSTGSSTPARKTYLDNILQPVHELDTSSIPGELIANLPKESSVIESISQESPFQPFEIPESFSGFSPAIMPVIQASPLATVHTVTISKFIGPGYLWDLWLGEHSQLGPVVLKLVYLPNYPCNRPEYEDYIPASDIIKEALKEESFYLGPLAIAQGEVVPRYHGLYHTSPGSNHIGMLLEYAGHALAPGIALLDEEWKNKVYSAYAKLHLHGVLHHDVSTQHILIDDRQRVRFVSFRRSTRKDLTVERDVRVLMIEAMKVRIRIGLERIQNVNSGSVPSCYYSHLENPTRFIEEIRAEENAPEPDWVVWQKRRLREMGPGPSCTYESYE